MMTDQKAIAHFDAVDLNQFNPGGNLHIATPAPVAGATTGDPAIVVKICGIYRTIKPYLQLVSFIPFIPGKVKAVINSAMLELDKVCPGS